jgi:hypothetical protein
MKRFINRLVGVSLLSLLLIAGVNSKTHAQNVNVSFQTFYDNLSPYGQWIYDPEFGDVWVPNEGGDFRPYGSRGHWLMTEYGNTWISEDPWGWAVYHYGRWTYNPYYGWIWVPGYEWAPAWVTWRFGGGYSGWAPLGPNVSVGISWAPPISWWVFVSPHYMYQPNLIRHWRGPSYNNTYINQTTIINNYFVDNHTSVRYNYGPRGEVIQRYTHQPVQVYQVSHLNRPGAPSVGRNTVSLYRPTVNQATVRSARPQNVIQAPRAIGRTVQAAPAPGRERQPQFRQELPRLQSTAPRGEQIQRGGQQPGGRGGEQIQRGGVQGQPGGRGGEQMPRGGVQGQPGGRGGEQIQRGGVQGQPGGRGGEQMQRGGVQGQPGGRGGEQIPPGGQPGGRGGEQMQREQQMEREQQARPNEQMQQREQQQRNEQMQRQQQTQREQQQRNDQAQRQQQMQREQQQRHDQAQRQQQMQREQQSRNEQMQRQQQQRNDQMQRQQQQRNDQMQMQRQQQQQMQQRQQQQQPQAPREAPQQGHPNQREGGGRR